MSGQNGYIGNMPTAVPLSADQLPNDMVPYAKMQNQETGDLLGRGDSGAGDTQPVFVGRGLSISEKNLLADAVAGAIRVTRRQSLLSAKTNAGVNAALATGGGATVSLSAVPTPLVMAFADGFNTYGPIDLVASQGSDTSYTGLPTDLTSYLYADYRGASNAVPEALLHFDGMPGSVAYFNDEYGNAWTPTNVTLSEAQKKFGRSAALFAGTGNLTWNGPTQFATKADETNSMASGQELSFWVRFTSLPASDGVRHTLWGAYNAAGYGLELNAYNQTGTIKFELRGSSNGSSWGVTTLGSVTSIAIDTWYRVRVIIVPDADVKLRVSNAGATEVLEITLAMTLPSATTKMVIGANGAGSQGMNAYADEFRLFPVVVDSGNVTPPASAYAKTGASLIFAQRTLPPQISEAYDTTHNALLHFEGSGNVCDDDYGNSWNVSGAGYTLVAGSPKIGAACGQFTAASSGYVDGVDIKSLGPEGWSIEGWINFATLPTTPNDMEIFSATNAAAFGARFSLNVTTGVTKLRWSLSSNGTTADLASAVLETSGRTVNTAQWYHFAVVYDQLAGKYLAYWDGVAVAGLSVTSANRICAIDSIKIGSTRAGGSYFNGTMDEFRFGRVCRYPNGTTFTPYSTVRKVEGDFFSVPEMVFYQVVGSSISTGLPPVMRRVNRLYLGEADNVGGTVTAVRNYAIQGRYVSAASAVTVSSATSYAHNLGVPPDYQVLKPALRCITNDQDHIPGEVTQLGNAATTTVMGASSATGVSRNSAKLRISANVYGYTSTGVPTAFAATKWNKYLIAERSF